MCRAATVADRFLRLRQQSVCKPPPATPPEQARVVLCNEPIATAPSTLPMPILDTHAHLTNSQFSSDLPSVLTRAASRDVTATVCVTLDPPDAAAAATLSTKHPSIHAAAGLHPCTVSHLSDSAALSAVTSLEALLSTSPRRTFVCVGEIGLDFTPRVLSGADATGTAAEVSARQRRVFHACLLLARAAGLPASVHSRGAGRHAVDMVAEVPGVRAVLHCFDGRAVYAERAVALEGCEVMMSVPPCVVRSEGLQKMVRRVPLERLLVETDSPVLGVVAAERNEPGEAVRAMEMIAALKGVGVEECMRVIDANARRMFPLVFECE